MSRRWTKRETDDLLSFYNTKDNKELSILFDRKGRAIFKKARALGLYKDPEIEFINRSNENQEEKNGYWHGGRKITKTGYVMILQKDHPRASANRGYVFEHDVVMENSIGRNLNKSEIVHHVNEVRADNRIENLSLMTRSEHASYHNAQRKRRTI